MRRNAKSITTSPDIVKHIDGLTEANFKLLTGLVSWLDAKEKTQQRYRSAVIDSLAKIEAGVSMLLVGQMAEQQLKKQPFYYPWRLEKDVKTTEEFISKHSLERGLAILKYIYSEPKETAPEGVRHGAPHDRRRKWQGWEI